LTRKKVKGRRKRGESIVIVATSFEKGGGGGVISTVNSVIRHLQQKQCKELKGKRSNTLGKEQQRKGSAEVSRDGEGNRHELWLN